jgi:lambda family phage portal protein
MAMRANLLDRAIGVFAPRLALKRATARAAFEAFSGAGSDGAPMSPMNGRWSVVSRSADADIVRGLKRQRAESRELRRTNPIAAGAIDTNINRAVGTGLQPVPQPDASVLGWTDQQVAEWVEITSREFSLWADSKECTLEGNQTFYERQPMVLGSRMESGDCFTILPDGRPTATQPYRLRLQLIEADRCATPAAEAGKLDIVEGVRLSGGAPVAYYILDAHPGAFNALGKTAMTGRWYEAIGSSGRRRILHHYRPTRPEQTRGVPYLAPVIQVIKDLGRYTEAEISAAVVSAFYTVFIEQDGASAPAPIFGAEQGAVSATPNETVPLGGQEIEMGPAAVIGLAKGEKANFANPNRPNTAYEPFVTGLLTLIGAGLGLPVELLVKKFNSSYSASRAALLDAWQHFRTERTWLALSFCQPVYETWMAEAVSTGRIRAPGFFSDPLVRWAYTRAAWHGDSQGSLNPKDEVAAYRDAIDARLMTHERAEWELFGSDFTRTFPIKKREQQMLADAGMLPVPKAGAAVAPAQQPTAGAQDDAAQLVKAAEALQQQAQALHREPIQLELDIHNEPIQVQIAQEPVQVRIEQADTHVHLNHQQTKPAKATQGFRVIPVRDPVTGLAREWLKVPMDSLPESLTTEASVADALPINKL